jgi:hypothetical protein
MKKMANHEAAPAPLGDRGFRQQFISEGGRNFETGPNIDDRNSDHVVSGEQGVQGQTGAGEESGR